MNLELLTPEQRYILNTVKTHADPFINRRVLLSYIQTSVDEPDNPFSKRGLINKVRDTLMELEEFNLLTVTADGLGLLSSGE